MNKTGKCHVKPVKLTNEHWIKVGDVFHKFADIYLFDVDKLVEISGSDRFCLHSKSEVGLILAQK